MIAVIYRYDPAASEKIDQLRPAHREFLATLLSAGTLRVAGAWVDSPADPGALLLLATPSPQAALDALEPDPFWRSGVITARQAYRWEPPIGSL